MYLIQPPKLFLTGFFNHTLDSPRSSSQVTKTSAQAFILPGGISGGITSPLVPLSAAGSGHTAASAELGKPSER